MALPALLLLLPRPLLPAGLPPFSPLLAAMAAAATTEEASLAARRASLGKASSPALAGAPAVAALLVEEEEEEEAEEAVGEARGSSLGLTPGLPRPPVSRGLRTLLGETGGGDRPGRGGTPPPPLLPLLLLMKLTPPPLLPPPPPPPPLLLLAEACRCAAPPRPGERGLERLPLAGDSSAARPGDRHTPSSPPTAALRSAATSCRAATPALLPTQRRKYSLI